MVYEWKDKVVLITGAASGIGAFIVRMLLETENVKHVTILDIAQNEGIAIEKELSSKFGIGKIAFRKCDVANDDQLFAGYQSVIDRFGNIDVVINNAALMNDSKDVYKKMVDVNVTAVCTSTIKAMELMSVERGGKGGTIINIGSIASLMQHSFVPIYFGTKSAVLQFTLCMSSDEYHIPSKVRFVTVCFGKTDTALISEAKLGTLSFLEDKKTQMMNQFTNQRPESAARGVIDAFKMAENGSTWIAKNDKPVEDISPKVKKAYEILSEGIV